jgi:hypothetical protein
MPKKPTLDTSNLNQIDTYTYPEYDRANIPPVGMAQYDTVARAPRQSMNMTHTLIPPCNGREKPKEQSLTFLHHLSIFTKA